MRASDLVRLSCGYATRRRWRALPSVIGVALGVTLLVVVLAAAQAIQTTGGQEVLGQESLRQITVSAAAVGGPNAMSQGSVQRFVSTAHVVAAYAVDEADVVGTVGSSGVVVPLANTPAPPDRPSLRAGRWPAAGEIAVPDSGLANKVGKLTPGNQLLGQTVVVAAQSFQGLGPTTSISLQVVGVYHAAASTGQTVPAYATLQMVMHLQALMASESDAAFAASATYPEIIVDVDSADNVSTVAAGIDNQGFVTNYVDKQVSGLTGHLEGVQVTIAYVALIVILLCALSVGNLVASSVRQRRSELGIMLAMGFRQRSLAAMVAGEALATGLAGALAGIVLAVAGILIFGALQPTAGSVVPWTALPVVLLVCAALCIAASLLPARRVLRLDCVEAIRAE